MQPAHGMEHWQKAIALIELAKKDAKVRGTLAEGSAAEVARLLREKADLTLEDLGAIYTDFEQILKVSLAGWFFHTDPTGSQEPRGMGLIPPDIPGRRSG
ncbi:MAG: hypothetical protein ACRDHY_14450 [Anaerolineales bacterium]